MNRRHFIRRHYRVSGAFALLMLFFCPALQAAMAAAWSHDGQRLVLALSDARETRHWLSDWDPRTGRKTGSDISAGEGARFTSLAFSADDSLLAAGRAGGSDGVILQVFSTAGGQRLQFRLPGETAADVLGFSSDKSLVFLRLAASGRVVSVALANGLERAGFGQPQAAALSPDGRWLALAQADEVQVLDLQGQVMPVSLPVTGSRQLAFDLDGQRLAVVADNNVQGWNFAEEKPLFRQPLPDLGDDVALVFGPDRRSLVVRVGSRARVLDRDTGSERRLIDGLEPMAPVLLFDPANRERLLAGGRQRLPQFFNIYLGGRQALLLDDPVFRAGASSRDGSWVAVAAASSQNESGFTRVWSLTGNDRLDLPGAAASLAFVGRQLLAVDDGRGRVVFWGLPGRELKGRIDNYCEAGGESRIVGSAEAAGLLLLRCDRGDGSVVTELRDASGALRKSWEEAGLALSADGGFVAFASVDGTLLEAQVNGSRLDYAGFRGDRVVFSADSRQLTVFNTAKALFAVFDNGRLESRLELPTGLGGEFSAVAVSENGTLVLAATDPGRQRTPLPIRQWQVPRGNFNVQLVQHSARDFSGGHLSRVVDLLPLADGKRFVSIDAGRVRLWEEDGRNRELY